MNEPVSLRILEREYAIACKPEERDELLQAARVLDARMREIRSGSRTASIDRIAVLAALNLAHELQRLQRREAGSQAATDAGLAALAHRLDRLLDASQP